LGHTRLMDYEFRDDKLFVSRTPAEREPILHRLRRIEGQVRGLVQMGGGRPQLLDEVQQANAVTAAMREVALMILASDLDAGIDFAVQSGEGDKIVAEVSRVTRAALKL
jgi:CsoR family transcriptional regulator, copper-sensing transcriptional repressor